MEETLEKRENREPRTQYTIEIEDSRRKMYSGGNKNDSFIWNIEKYKTKG